MTQNPGEWGGAIHPQAFGAILRDSRLALGRSLEDAERQTRILVRHLAALEAGDFAMLPAGIYARGFVHNYASYLRLNPQEMVRLYNEARGEVEDYYRPQPVARPMSTAGPIAPNFVVIVFVVGMLAVATAWGYTLLVQPPKTPLAAVAVTQANATPTTIVARTPTVAANGAANVAVVSTGVIVVPTPTVEPTPVPTQVAVTLKASGLSYIDILVDGQAFKTNYPTKAGETLTPPPGKSIVIKSSKPSVVTYTVNGEDKGTLPNESYVVKYPAGFEIKAGGDNTPAPMTAPVASPKTTGSAQPRG